MISASLSRAWHNSLTVNLCEPTARANHMYHACYERTIIKHTQANYTIRMYVQKYNIQEL